VTRGFKVLMAMPFAAIAAVLSIAAIAAFLVATGVSVGIAITGTLIAIALWLACFSAIGRLVPDVSD
jgi:hypothetical protein